MISPLSCGARRVSLGARGRLFGAPVTAVVTAAFAVAAASLGAGSAEAGGWVGQAAGPGPVVPHCSTAQLRLRFVDTQAAAGRRYIDSAFTNAGARECSLRGYPTGSAVGQPRSCDPLGARERRSLSNLADQDRRDRFREARVLHLCVGQPRVLPGQHVHVLWPPGVAPEQRGQLSGAPRPNAGVRCLPGRGKCRASEAVPVLGPV